MRLHLDKKEGKGRGKERKEKTGRTEMELCIDRSQEHAKAVRRKSPAYTLALEEEENSPRTFQQSSILQVLGCFTVLCEN